MTLRILAPILAMLVALPALAQTNVGVVNIDLVFRSSTRAQAAFAEVEAFRLAKRAELKTLGESYQEKVRRLQTDASLSDGEQASLTREIQNEKTRLDRTQEDATREGQRLTNKALGALERQLAPLVEEVARDKNLQLILQADPDAGIVFFDPVIDITADVVAKLDAQP